MILLNNTHFLNTQFLDYRQFYLCLDNDLLVDSFKTEIEYIRKNWRQVGRPTLTLPVTHSFLGRFIVSLRKFCVRH